MPEDEGAGAPATSASAASSLAPEAAQRTERLLRDLGVAVLPAVVPRELTARLRAAVLGADRGADVFLRALRGRRHTLLTFEASGGAEGAPAVASGVVRESVRAVCALLQPAIEPLVGRDATLVLSLIHI